jgi:hypothetical protein
MATRSGFLTNAALLAGAAAIGACARGGSKAQDTSATAPPSPDLQHFLALSSLLTGYASLDAASASAYLKVFRDDADRSGALDELLARVGVGGKNSPASLDDLAKRGAFSDPESLALTSQILSVWFSGTVFGKDGMTTQTWQGALAWDVCTFTKPPATCGGLTGYWAKAPA